MIICLWITNHIPESFLSFPPADSKNSVQTWDPANIDKTWLTNTDLITATVHGCMLLRNNKHQHYVLRVEMCYFGIQLYLLTNSFVEKNIQSV